MKKLSFLFLSLILTNCISCGEKTTETKPQQKSEEKQEEISIFIISTPYPIGTTPLHRAAESGDAKKVEALLLAGANPNAKTDGGAKPLFIMLAQEVAMQKQQEFLSNTEPI